MAAQLLPIIKAVAPYIAQIATAAIPAFTRKPAETAKSDPVIVKQIEELQAAATQNAQSIHLLAEKLQQASKELETAAQDANKRIAAYTTMLFVALGLAGISAVLCVYLLLR